MENGLTIAMTPVQLAAVMADETATGDAISNRIWGGVGFLGSVLELASATTLCLVPEPTGLTKAGCIVVGAHSLDGIGSSAYQVYTGKKKASMTARATAGIAKDLGASKNAAEQIGIAVDMVIPFAVAGAARVASVTMGQVKLISHEAVKGIMGGGHTIKKHVGKSLQDMLDKRARGIQSRTYRAGSISSSFTSQAIAEKALSQAIKANRTAIRRWAKSTPVENKDYYLQLTHTFNKPVGILLRDGETTAVETNRFIFVFYKKSYNGKPYYLLTAYPI